MPKLLYFIPCERVIVSREGPLSLITVVEGLKLQIPAEEFGALPDDAISPVTWNVVAKWMREDNEEPQHWEQRVQIVTPNGRVSTNSITAFDLVNNVSMRNLLQVNGIPIKPLGQGNVVLSLRQSGGDDAAWQVIATYPIVIANHPPNPEE
ncbi:MAG: hypothetical protein AABO41_02520 [Acidobacteriota bacterium]